VAPFHSVTVEVKGATSDGAQVVLTAGEVLHHAGAYPHNALIVVRHINLDRRATPPTCSEGRLYEARPWSISQTSLRPISYRYQVPLEMYTDDGDVNSIQR
jgi:hypothetical protein